MDAGIGEHGESGGIGHRVRMRMAEALALSPAAPLRVWLLRLFVLAPARRRPWPRWLLRVVRPLRARAARGLRIAADAPPSGWLSALVWALPPPKRRGAGAFIAWLLMPVLAVFASLLRYAGRGLDRIDWLGLSRRAEHLARRSEHAPPALRVTVVLAGLCVFSLVASAPLELSAQLGLAVVLWSMGMLLRRVPGRFATLIMVGLSLLATGRYVWWRLSETLYFGSALDALLGFGLLFAEVYTWLILLLGYVQTAWPLARRPALLPSDPGEWPSVDVYIPSYNEPLKVVQPTVLAAMGLDWPAHKLKVYILDDGRREEFRRFAEEAGCGYIIRSKNDHAKAGNLNHALTKTDGELIAIFDCDHIPARSFLQLTVGWFLRDPSCAMLQTPHHFFSPDPFERNLDVFRKVPNEGTLFYGLVQDGNDLWNATFFCGSCAVLRRGPLEEVGGIAVETVTEDAHTALKMHRRGYNTAYLNLAQAAGLATESLSGHVAQRIRWARGMAQIFRVDNPLFGRGLGFFQRLCYANAMLHFFYGLPRIIFLTAPLAYLFFHAYVIHAEALTLAIFALPHIVQASLTNSRVQGHYRHSFWAEAYETVLAWYIARPTLLALINPRIGKFNVTAKGGLVEKPYFDWHIALPFLVLAGLNLCGLVVGLFRLLVWNPAEAGTVLLNLAWTVYNLNLLGMAMSVASEARQLRTSPRSPMRIEAVLRRADGECFAGETLDYSTQGVGLRCEQDPAVRPGQEVELLLRSGDDVHAFPAEVVPSNEGRVALRLRPMTVVEQRAWIRATFGRADAWLSWSAVTRPDRALRSLGELLGFGFTGYLRAGRSAWHRLRGHAPAPAAA